MIRIAIVGGGIMGSSAALFLRRMGISVVLLERDEVNTQLEGVIKSYELAFQMQRSVPETLSIDSQLGTRMRDALDQWWKKAEGKAVIDYGFHMIVTELEDAGLGAVALHGLPLVLDSTVIDTAAPDAAERFAEAEPDLAKGLAEIRDETGYTVPANLGEEMGLTMKALS